MSKRKKRSNRTSLKQHKRHKKTLTPPLAALPKLKSASWKDDRLPEMLWAALLITGLPRGDALKTFHQVGNYVSRVKELGETMYDISLTGLSKSKPENLRGLLQVIIATEAHRNALKPLLLFEGLPAREIWEAELDTYPSELGWQKLARAVAFTLDHQSQEATDCRWVRLLCMVSSGKVTVLPEFVEELAYYPNYGDMRKVRPHIRASELGFSDLLNFEPKEWPDMFWTQCLSDTACFPIATAADTLNDLKIGTTLEHVKEVYSHLMEHSFNTRVTTAIDVRHDTVFGHGLYALSILQELLRVGASQTIMSRIGLRTLVECLISLAYLAKKDELELWKTYRVYGAGQVKLSLLKLEEIEEDLSFVSLETLRQLANEDIWEEFLPIELGHWANLDTRKMSIDAAAKDTYDQYYGWTSAFAHSHWGAIRDTVYDTCGNPLHRLHRIPRQTSKDLPDVVPDACKCTDKVLEIVSSCYPDFRYRVTINSEN